MQIVIGSNLSIKEKLNSLQNQVNKALKEERTTQVYLDIVDFMCNTTNKKLRRYCKQILKEIDNG